MDIFSNREVAAIIWMIIVIGFVMFAPGLKDVRVAFKGVIAAFFVWKLQSVTILMLAYISVIIYCFSEIGIWDVDQLKNTILWALSVAAMSVFQVESIKNDKDFFKHSVSDNLKLIAILEFIVGVYSFSLLAELVILPIVTLVILIGAVAARDPKHASVKKLTDIILTSFGVVVIVCTMYMLFTNPEEIAKEQAIYDFSIPPLLTLCFVPFIFALMVYTTYETVLVRTNFSIDKKGHRLFAKYMAMVVFNVRIELLERWSSRLPLRNIKSYLDICKSIWSILQMSAAERNPKSVAIKDGWSPYAAKDALQHLGFKTGYYCQSFDEEWLSSCPYIEIGDGILPNNIAYYVGGDKGAAKRLKLIINVNEPGMGKDAHEKLMEAGAALLKYATGLEIPVGLRNALRNGTDIRQEIANTTVIVEKEIFPNKARIGYSVKFTIEI